MGLGLGDVVTATVHLQPLERDVAACNEVYGRRFGSPYPVRTTVGSDLMGILVEIDLVEIDVVEIDLVEIDVVAVRPSSPPGEPAR